MEKLKKTIEQYGRWSRLSIYTGRIETSISTDFSLALENAKALLEAISVEICRLKKIEIEANASINSVLKRAFTAIGYKGDNRVTQISSALATIGQQIGELRNEIGATSHGKSLEALKERNYKVDGLTKEFLIDTTEIIACFLIRTFENENPRSKNETVENKLEYNDNEDFNDSWDDFYGEFFMGAYAYIASEILYYVDYSAYLTEHKTFIERKEGEDSGG